MNSVRSVSATDERTDSDRSIATFTWIALGSAASMTGKRARICETVFTTLLPGVG